MPNEVKNYEHKQKLIRVTRYMQMQTLYMKIMITAKIIEKIFNEMF